ncbi:Retrovirus-related Pol polyprotein from transposon TNT 1-94 [Araneus ventricosus]|uniref:Retrovirus-related Pol polyprotein from transposon TNT 1-94 n=1 Tax=Araneus ventricosus TaxID=182803 RepID=A0A4Y2UU78_ARAVE|nr:Retrovirus-related Pol polyprotein from transposon TNT 1-94 [Araneus ventricosus]
MTLNKFGRTLKVLRSDNGGEYIGKEIEDFLKEQGIVHQLTVPYSPQQNEVSERKNRTLIEMTRCLLSDANLPQRFWAEAAMTETYLQNFKAKFPSLVLSTVKFKRPGNQAFGQYLSVHKDSLSKPPTNRRLEEADVVDWPKMMKFKAS